MNVVVIPARGGSRRIPRKNIRPFFGKPIIAYSIEVAKASGLFSAVFVSTEDVEIIKVAHDYGAFTIHRPARLAADEVGTQEVMRDALKELDGEYACCIYPCAPTLTPRDLTGGLSILEATSPDVRYVYCEGVYYWGRVAEFLNRPEITKGDCMSVRLWNPWVDINTEEDWKRAEGMYAALRWETA